MFKANSISRLKIAAISLGLFGALLAPECSATQPTPQQLQQLEATQLAQIAAATQAQAGFILSQETAFHQQIQQAVTQALANRQFTSPQVRQSYIEAITSLVLTQIMTPLSATPATIFALVKNALPTPVIPANA